MDRLPPGYVYLNRNEAKNALRFKEDAVYMKSLMKFKDLKINDLQKKVDFAQIEIDEWKCLVNEHRKFIKNLKRKLFWKHVQVAGLGAVSIFFGIKSI